MCKYLPILTLADLDGLSDALLNRLNNDIPGGGDYNPCEWSNLVSHFAYRSLGLPDNALELARKKDEQAKLGEDKVWEADLAEIIHDMMDAITKAAMIHYCAEPVKDEDRIFRLISGEWPS